MRKSRRHIELILLNTIQKTIQLLRQNKSLRMCLELIIKSSIRNKLMIMEKMYPPKVFLKILIYKWKNLERWKQAKKEINKFLEQRPKRNKKNNLNQMLKQKKRRFKIKLKNNRKITYWMMPSFIHKLAFSNM